MTVSDRRPPSFSLLSTLAVTLAGWERESTALLHQELAIVRRRAGVAESTLADIRWLVSGQRAPEPTAEEWASVGVRPDLQADPPYADGAHAEPLDPDADEGVPDERWPGPPDADAPVIVASQPPLSAPPVQPLAPTRRPPPPAAPIQEPPRAPIPAEAREGDIPDPGSTVALRKPVLLACRTIEEAESCRRWPRWESHEGTLEPLLRQLVGLLQEVEAAERAGDAGVLRDIRSRKLLESRPGVASRCQAALDRLLEPPSPSSTPSAASAAPETVPVVSEAVAPVTPTAPTPPPGQEIDLESCPV